MQAYRTMSFNLPGLILGSDGNERVAVTSVQFDLFGCIACRFHAGMQYITINNQPHCLICLQTKNKQAISRFREVLRLLANEAIDLGEINGLGVLSLLEIEPSSTPIANGTSFPPE